MKTIPQKYQTTDGREFDSQEAAEQHEAVVGAQKACETALSNYAQLLAQNYKTADGFDFSWRWSATYYYINDRIYRAPQMEQLSFYRWNAELRHESYGEAVRIWTEVNGQRQYFDIGELYYDKSNAVKATIEKQIEWLRDERKYIEEFAKQHGFSGHYERCASSLAPGTEVSP